MPPSLKIQTYIAPTKGWIPIKFRELWLYRELLYFLVWRDVKVRYKQTIIGAGWAVIQPFFTMVIFSLFFGQLAKIDSNGIPYPIFSYAALVPWTFFANGLTFSSNSLVASNNLIKKIYFPRLIIPVATVFAGLIDFALAFIVLLVMMVFYGILPTLNVVWLPLFILLAFITSLGVGVWLAAMNVQFRDIRYVVPFIVQLWMFATPIVYPSDLIENEVLRGLYAINPMVGVIEGFRWALLDTDTSPNAVIIISSLVSFAVLVSGAFYFRRMEKTFADVI